MNPLLAQADATMFFSLFKPLLIVALMIGWGRIATRFDKDLAYFHLPRTLWNSGFFASFVIALTLWFWIPIFWLGLPVALIFAAGPLIGYVFYRNTQVDEHFRWDLSLSFLRGRYASFQQDRAARQASVSFVNKEGVPYPPPTRDDNFFEPHQHFGELMEAAIERHADSVEMRVGSDKVEAAMEIDGVTFPYTALEPAPAVALIDYVKTQAGLDVEDRRKQQQGRVRITTSGESEEGGGPHELEVTTAGSTRGLMLKLLIDPAARKQMKLEELGLLKGQLESVRKLTSEPGRIVIVSTPPKHGLTTTLYSLVSQHDPYTEGIVTLEEQIDGELEGVSHVKLAPQADGKAKSEKLGALIRRDPNVVMLSQVSDAYTPKVIASDAEHIRFYFGLRLEEGMQAIRGWARAVGDPQQASDALAAVISERLVRKLCVTCRVPYQPDPSQLRKLNLSPEKVGQLYKHSGKVKIKDREEKCPTCGGVGYRGRTGVFEVLVLDDKARELLAGGQFEPLKAHFRKQRMPRLDEAALSKVVSGETSISEVTRAMNKGKSSGSGGGEKPSGDKPAEKAAAAGGEPRPQDKTAAE